MPNFKILIFEDDTSWVDAFKFNILPKAEILGKQIIIMHKVDDATLMQDLEWLPSLIIIDYDLVYITGESIISSIANDPDYNHVQIFFYSGGESLEALTGIANNYECGVRCFTKEGEDLENAILALL